MVPRSAAIAVASAAIFNDSAIDSRTSSRPSAIPNQRSVKSWSGKLNALVSVLKAYMKMTRIGKCMKASPSQAADFRPRPAVPSERIEGSEALRDRDVDRDQHDRHHGERRRHRDVPHRSLLYVDEAADEQTGRTDQR